MFKLMQCVGLVALLASPLCGPSFAQDTPQKANAASLMEQGKQAEEQRDFKQAESLFTSAAATAASEKNSELVDAASKALARVKSRAAGIAAGAPQGDNDPIICRLGDRMDTIARFSDGDEREDAYNDVALLGAIAVPWLEKAIQGPYRLCNYDIRPEPSIWIRALARMSAPEGSALLERLLSSPDPMARRAVAQYADPDRHRAILLRALKDPAQAVREQAIKTLAQVSDSKLSDVMIAAAREGNESALVWVRSNRPESLVADAKNTALSTTIRSRALEELWQASGFRPDAEAIDGLLALARTPGEAAVRNAAMSLMRVGAEKRWQPLAPESARRIETALLSELDAYPPEAGMGTLMAVGSARALAPIVERGPFDNTGVAVSAISRILSRSGPADFTAVAAAFAKAPTPLRGTQNMGYDQAHSMLRLWLESMATQDVPSADIARGANNLDSAQRRIYVDNVVVPWIQRRVPQGASNARAPAIDPAFVKLLREIAADSGQSNLLPTVAIALAANRDPALLPDLLGFVGESQGIDGNTAQAIKRVVADDPARVRTVLELLLAKKSLQARSFSESFLGSVGARPPAELLALANSLWSKANAEKLIALVAGAVPGPEGSAFLLAHYGELEPVAADTRIIVMDRFGQELYEPATELIGAALRDPNSRVRSQAAGVFERFKQQQQVIDNFNEWMKADQQSKQTVAELTALLDSQNADVVVGAVKALAALKSRASYPKLVQLLDKHKNDAAVKTAVMEAIDALK